ncbi:hypothetical protein Xen7305DRAFT_00018810 [Xenococcus sp. PCC 7305]|uniref:YdcF family protein n=1 Tax=Xenococcus sp. PCC 7305 TaxID=102125 RepID=UPI0002AD089E|nr:YdcF family protein [Xenococcus sp. PCC 7305]ELS02169.1 hypothetical protein Xen7305DRAFT_00018810 [Xenococcus sp. PCC 7305]
MFEIVVHMSRKRGKYHHKCYPFLWSIALIGIFVAIMSINIAIASLRYPQPQAILCLGGDHQREKLAAKLASQNKDLLIWVSSGSNDQITGQIFHNAGLSSERFFLNNQATDTVTNFTTLVPEFKQHHIKHLYLITSDFHMPRARAIAMIVLGSQGIVVTPMEVRTRGDRQEPKVKILRDTARSIFWFFSGYAGPDIKREKSNNFNN